MRLLQLLAQTPPAVALASQLPQGTALLRRWLQALRAGRVPLEALVVRQKLSRMPDHYRSPSAAARAALQLQAAGKKVRPGQVIRLVFTRGEPGVRAWDLPGKIDPAAVNVEYYTRLLLRAAATALYPLAISEDALRERALSGAYQESLIR
ncbi:MAG: hypothetical protein U1B80_10240 [Anaerolineaceae bacterium]|nr:hypothetical protein [Anaerolineaceae bacterium]